MKKNAVLRTMLTILLINIVTIVYGVVPVTADPWVIATVDIDPDTLNLKSKSEWITCYIELPGLFEVRQIYISIIRLNGTIQAAPPFELGDYDEDFVPDLMVRFNRTEVTNHILENYRIVGRFGEVTLTVTGEVGMLPYFLIVTFEGSDTIRVIDK